MSKPKFFKSLSVQTGKSANIPLPVFFPDATRAVLRSLDSRDIENTKTQGILVNTFHLYKSPGANIIKKYGGIKKFMNFKGGVISDSGGFQINTLGSKVTDLLTPEKSVEFQVAIGTDMVVVLDDFTPRDATRKQAEKTVKNTIEWAKRSKAAFVKATSKLKAKPYLLGVVQGGKYQDLRAYCTQELVKIGFDGLGYGGWPMDENDVFDVTSAKTIADNSPSNYFLYGLGIGKPDDIATLTKLGYNIFDCVLPTRDARHGRLYVYNAKSIKDINLTKKHFYSYYSADTAKHLGDKAPVSFACDCLLCTNYSRGYLTHLFKTGDYTAGRLATIHNLRFYSILMEKLRTILK